MARKGYSEKNQRKNSSGKPAESKIPTTGKKPFVKPELKKHGSLPEVTGGFFGTFDPNANR